MGPDPVRQLRDQSRAAFARESAIKISHVKFTIFPRSWNNRVPSRSTGHTVVPKSRENETPTGKMCAGQIRAAPPPDIHTVTFYFYLTFRAHHPVMCDVTLFYQDLGEIAPPKFYQMKDGGVRRTNLCSKEKIFRWFARMPTPQGRATRRPKPGSAARARGGTSAPTQTVAEKKTKRRPKI